MKQVKLAFLGAMSLMSFSNASLHMYPDEEGMKEPDPDMIHQSPIDIKKPKLRGGRWHGKVTRVKGDDTFDYSYGKLTYSDAVRVNEHAVMFKFKDEETGTLTSSRASLWYDDAPSMTFKAVQFHFHSGVDHADVDAMGSEHTYNGKHFPLELHIVHLNEDEDTQDLFKAAVVGVMFKAVNTDEESFADEFLQRLFTGEEVDTQTEFIDHLNLGNRFVYRGSLTTPPYSEFLFWNMVPKTIKINYETLKMFRHHIPLELEGGDETVLWGEANRDVQKLNGRHIYWVHGVDNEDEE